MENGMLQIWHKKAKESGKWYTALVSVDKFGKLQFNFDTHIIALAINAFAECFIDLGFESAFEFLSCEKEIKVDLDKFKERS